jgi:hypothetical protein
MFALAALITPAGASADGSADVGSISGTVTEEGGGLLELVCITLYEASERAWTGHGTTADNSGAYRLEDVEAGSYTLEFWDCDDRFDHEIEWYNDKPTWEEADVVAVTGSVETTGIDAQLSPITSTTVHVTEGGNGSGHVISDPPGIDCRPVCEAQFPWDTVVRLTPTPDERSYFTHWTNCDEVQGTTCLITTDTVGTYVYPSYEILDSVPPETGISSAPESSSSTGNATFWFWTDKPAYGWWECSLDGAEFDACSYPLHYQDLADGPHTFRVRSVDRFDQRDPTPAEWTWTIDTGIPDTGLTFGPPAMSTEPRATFSFFSNRQDATFECSLDDGPFMECSSPYTTPSLPEGTHAFKVRARTPRGVDPTPATRSWVVDTSGPLLSIVRPTAGTYVNDQPVGGVGPILVFGYVSVEVTAVDPQSGVWSVGFDVDGLSVDSSTITRQGDTYRFPYRPASPGPHTITFRATNGSGLPSSASISLVGVPAP